MDLFEMHVAKICKIDLCDINPSKIIHYMEGF